MKFNILMSNVVRACSVLGKCNKLKIKTIIGMDIYYCYPNYYVVWPESIQPFSVSREPVTWP